MLMLVVIGFLSFETSVGAFSTLDTRLDEKPVTLTVLGTNSFVGETASGRQFTQSRIVSSPDIRIHKFVLGETFFYISDRGIVLAQGDLEAISIYLALG